MKKTLLALTLALAPSLAPSLALADPVHGMWKTQVDDGSYALVEMGSCSGGKTCGWIRRTFDDSGEYQSENIGKVLVINMENVGGGAYKDSVWRPANDKIYIGKMELAGNTLSLSGCIVGGLLCKAQSWTRAQ